MRPLWALRCLLRLGASMILLSVAPALAFAAAVALPVAVAPGVARLGLGELLVLRHRVMRQNLALEHPDLDAASAVGGLGRAVAEIDVGAQRVKRHAALAIPLHARDLGAAEAAGAVDADAERAQPHRR